MSEKIVVPTLGESVTEATVSKWLKSVGENVDSDEPIVELETDKVNVEVPSPLTGTLEKINVKEGQTVEVGAMLGSVSSDTLDIAEKHNKEQIKKYTPPKKEKEKDEVVLFEKPAKKKNIEKPTNGVEPLILNNAQEEEPLILEEENLRLDNQEDKTQKQISPSARKIPM